MESKPGAHRLVISCFAFFSLLSQHTLAQKGKRELDSLSRTMYVEQFKSYFFVWPVLKQRNTSFFFKNGNTKLSYAPNVNYHLGAGFFVFGLGVQIVFPLSPSSQSEKIYGHSSAVDIQANVLGKNWGVDLFTQNYRGYYLEDNNKPLGKDIPRIQRPDITTWNNGVNGIYFFNKRRYSMRSTYNYYERQLRSAGSFIISGNFNIFSMRADSLLFSSSYQPVLGYAANVNKMDYTTVSVAPGYAYTFVIRKSYFIGMAAAVGPAFNWLRYSSSNEVWKSIAGINSYLDLRLSTGYNSEHFFIGIAYSIQTRDILYEGILFSSSNGSFKFATGYRFKEVGILKRRAYDIFRPKSSL